MSKVPPEHEYFFAVGSPGTVMSCVWHIWTWLNGHDIYITEQGSLNSFHASLHKNDKCHITFTKEFIVEQRKHGNFTLTNRTRKTHEWKTTEIMEGVQLPFRLLIPASELHPSAPGWSTQKQVVCLPIPPSDLHTRFDCTVCVRDLLSIVLMEILAYSGNVHSWMDGNS
jgi:hypothetical protein